MDQPTRHQVGRSVLMHPFHGLFGAIQFLHTAGNYELIYFYLLSRLYFQRKRHYWILDWKSITLYQNESSTKYYKVQFMTLVCSMTFNNTRSLSECLASIHTVWFGSTTCGELWIQRYYFTIHISWYWCKFLYKCKQF